MRLAHTLRLVALSVLATSVVWGSDWFVSVSGSDTATGISEADPFKTLTKAINSAKAGDTIWVAPGTYAGGISITKNLTIASLAGAKATVIRGGGATGVSMTAGKLKGFTVSGYSTEGVRFQHQSPGNTPRAEGCIFTGCGIGFNGAYNYACPQPVVANSVFDGNTIGLQNGNGINCYFVRNTDKGYGTLYTQGSNEKMVNCVFEPDQKIVAARMTIYNTLFSNNAGHLVSSSLLKNVIRSSNTGISTSTYKPSATSPVLNVGRTSTPYISTEVDLLDSPRSNGTVDLGAVEWWLDQPTGVSIELHPESYSATISWEPVPEADVYTFAGQNTTATSITLTNLLPGSNYTYTVVAKASNVTGCQNWSESKPITFSIPVTLEVSPKSTEVVYPAGALDFNVTSNWTWSVRSNVSWATPIINEHGFTVQYTQNDSIDSREATITISCLDKDVTATIVQTGFRQLPLPILKNVADPFREPFTARLIAENLPVNGTLIYTLDGSEPTPANALAQATGTNPSLDINVTNTTTLKARLLSSSINYAHSPTLTQTMTREWPLIVDATTNSWHVGGDVVTITAPEVPDSTFVTWLGYTNSTSNPLELIMPTAPVVLTTSYAAITYPVTVDGVTQGAFPKGSNVTVRAPVREGYDFTSWSGDIISTSNPFTFTMPAQGVHLTTYYTAKQYNVTINGAFVRKGTYGSSIILAAPEKPGYLFASWGGYIASTDNPLSFTMPASNVELIANYEVSKPTLLAPINGDTVAGHIILQIDSPLPNAPVRWFVNNETAPVAENNSADFEATDYLVYGTNTWSAEVMIDGKWIPCADSSIGTFVLERPKTLYVSPKGNGRDGIDWTNAFTNLQDAIDAAFDGVTILVTNGTYKTGTTNSLSTRKTRLYIDKSVSIRSVNGADATHIQGNGADTYTTEDAIHCLVIEGSNLHIELEGLAFSGGANVGGNLGGAIYVHATESSITLLRCALNDSQADAGSAISVAGRDVALHIESSVIAHNTGDYPIYSEALGSSVARLVNCTLVRNRSVYSITAGFSIINTLLVANDSNNINEATTAECNYATNDTNIFVDEVGRNYSLRSVALECIDTGNSSAVISMNDYNGNPRIQGMTVDIGAFELAQNPLKTSHGTPISWLLTYFPDATDFEAFDLLDSDGDGFLNYEEYITGSDPIDKTSFLQANIQLTNGVWSIFPTQPIPHGRTIQVLGAPTPIGPFTTPTNSTSQFFKIKVSLTE